MSHYLVVSLPTSIVPSAHQEEAFEAIQSAAPPQEATCLEFKIPTFKIGTLDALVQQADDIAKIDGAVEGAVQKAAEVIKSIYDNEDMANNQKRVDGKPFDVYLRGFKWNTVKYRIERPVNETINIIKKEINDQDQELKTRFQNYNTNNAALQSIQRRKEGNLSTKSLASLLDKDQFIESEYMVNVLVAVAKQSKKEFLGAYETMCPMIVPRSAQQLAEDKEYTLYSVVVFKKHATEFTHKLREAKYIPRDYDLNKTTETEQEDYTKAKSEAENAFSQVRSLATTTYSELLSAWMHIKAIRVFVESALRYGLPLDFVSTIFVGYGKNGPKAIKKTKDELEKRYDFLGGNAYGRDKKGKITRKDDAEVSQYTSVAGGAGEDYTPFVEYEFEVA